MLKILTGSELQKRVAVVIGTRPGIVMFSPIIRELARRQVPFFTIHAGQHYSYNMDRQFFQDLNLPDSDYKLEEVKNCKLHGEQTARMLEGIEKILLQEKPRIVIVGGDANCNLAGALAARKLRIMVAHLEAGERSYDWRMPEEHNRRIIDHISEFLFATNEKSRQNLLKEQVQGEIFITGNPIVDAALQNQRIATEKSDILKRFDLTSKKYFILTTHREENVDSKDNLENIISGMGLVAERIGMPIVFLAHPRTKNRLEQFGLLNRIKGIPNFLLKDAVGYLDFLFLLAKAQLSFTDSGGVQQESCILKRPCVTLRENTEWIETVDSGVNILAGTNPAKILAGAKKMVKFAGPWPQPFGAGKSAAQIVAHLRNKLAG